MGLTFEHGWRFVVCDWQACARQSTGSGKKDVALVVARREGFEKRWGMWLCRAHVKEALESRAGSGGG